MVMLTPSSLEELHELVADRISALDASAYDHGPLSAAWRESGVPLNALTEPDFLQHLAFSVLLEGAPNTGRDRGRSGETGRHRVDFAVLFAFQLVDRPEGKIGDLKLAYAAARDLRQAVLRDWPGGNLAIRNAWFPGQIVHDYLPVRVEFSAWLDLAV